MAAASASPASPTAPRATSNPSATRKTKPRDEKGAAKTSRAERPASEGRALRRRDNSRHQPEGGPLQPARKLQPAGLKPGGNRIEDGCATFGKKQIVRS